MYLLVCRGTLCLNVSFFLIDTTRSRVQNSRELKELIQCNFVKLHQLNIEV